MPFVYLFIFKCVDIVIFDDIAIGGWIPFIIIDAIENAIEFVCMSFDMLFKSKPKLRCLDLFGILFTHSRHDIGQSDAPFEEIRRAKRFKIERVAVGVVDVEVFEYSTIENSLMLQIVNGKHRFDIRKILFIHRFYKCWDRCGVPIVCVENIWHKANLFGKLQGGFA